MPAGSTALSSGLIPAAGTRFQKDKGDRPTVPISSPSDILRKAHGRTDDALARAVAAMSGEPFTISPTGMACSSSSSRASFIRATRSRACTARRAAPARSSWRCSSRLPSEDGLDILTSAHVTRLFVTADDARPRRRGDATERRTRTDRMSCAGPGLQRLRRQSGAGQAAHSRDREGALLRPHRQSGRCAEVGRSAGSGDGRPLRLSGPWLGRASARCPDHLGADDGGRRAGERCRRALCERACRLLGAGRGRAGATRRDRLRHL